MNHYQNDPNDSSLGVSFHIGGFSFRIEPGFWLFLLVISLLTVSPNRGWRESIISGGSLGIAIFLGVFFHELGHAMMARWFRLPVGEIVFEAFGGSCGISLRICSRLQVFFISAAGPVMDFVLGGLVLFIYFALVITGKGQFLLENLFLQYLGSYLVMVSFFWGIINLLPIYPMDGSYVLQSLLGPVSTPSGVYPSIHRISVVLAIMCVVASLFLKWYFSAALFGLFAFQNLQWVKFYRG